MIKILALRTHCPNSFTKYEFLQEKNSNATIVNGLSVSNGDLLAYSIYKMRKLRKTKLGQVVKVRAHYPSYFSVIQGGGDESYAAVRGDEAESPEEGKT